ncbi:MAG: transporter, family, cyanate transporter [Candidatus Eremiobacteraeota bacterium]|jgi:CP family cyanate transporter-like MFS transporter|nr:transporter, family, cyanate transporter [Candidatus Eremiobacteraeota bacterium]
MSRPRLRSLATEPRAAPGALRIALLWLAGIDLRLTLLAVPPVIPLIHRDLHLNESGIAALSNLPVLVLAGSSVFGALLTTRLGARRAMVVGLWVIALSSALRGVGPSIAMLFAATLVMGVGIAMIQPAFPSLARAWFGARTALGTGIWANGLLCGEAISASLTIPFILPLVGGSWERSFVAWSIPVGVTALALGFVRDPAGGADRANGIWLPDFRDRRVWLLGIFQSAASMTYFGANTFLPDFLHATGQPGLVGATLAALNIGQLPASIAVGFIPMRILGKRATSLLVAALILAAIGGVVLFGGVLAVACAALLGLTGAYVLTMSFALPALIAPPAQIARLAAGTFTLGYAISFLTTLLSGAAWDATHAPTAAFVPMLAAAAIVAVLGPRLGALVARAAESAG